MFKKNPFKITMVSRKLQQACTLLREQINGLKLTLSKYVTANNYLILKENNGLYQTFLTEENFTNKF